MYLFYDQIELELVGYCQSCHLENLEFKLCTQSITNFLCYHSIYTAITKYLLTLIKIILLNSIA